MRAKYGLHEGDEVDVVDDGGLLCIVRVEGAKTRGQRLVRRLRGSVSAKDVEGMTTDQRARGPEVDEVVGGCSGGCR